MRILLGVLTAIILMGGTYVLGRIFWKAGIDELDLYLGKKLTEYVNNKLKEKENGKDRN